MGLIVKEIGTYEAKTHLAQVLQEVARGEKFTITKHGMPVAMLVPVEHVMKRNAAATAQKIQQAKRWKLPGGCSIKDLIEEGRR